MTKDNKKLAFAVYLNHVTLPPDMEAAQTVAGEALGEIAAAAYDSDLSSSGAASAGENYDLLIRNGHIIDGTGNPWFAGDVAVSGDRIAAVGDLREAHGKREVDAQGRIVAPGFIDRKSTRLNSSHVEISYAVFCLKKKKKKKHN